MSMMQAVVYYDKGDIRVEPEAGLVVMFCKIETYIRLGLAVRHNRSVKSR